MHKLYVFFVFIYLLVGCENAQPIKMNTIKNIEYNESEKDSILKANLNEYQTNLINGNYDLAYKYLYYRMIVHMQKKFPDENIDDKYIKEKILKYTYDIFSKLEKKVHLEYNIGGIEYKDSINNTLLYIVKTSLDAKIAGKRKSIQSRVLCFSNNNGNDWQFMEYDPEITPLILNENFSNDFSQKILKQFSSKK